jgi:hypothetical protein
MTQYNQIGKSQRQNLTATGVKKLIMYEGTTIQIREQFSTETEGQEGRK